MNKQNKYTVNEFLVFLKRNDIILVLADEIGEVELPEVSTDFIIDCDLDGDIKN